MTSERWNSHMNLFDIIIVLFILLSGIVGLKRGVLKELVMVIGVILVYTLAFSLKGPVANILIRFCPFFQFFGHFKGLTVLNILFYQILAFLLLAFLFLFLFKVILKVTGLLQKIIDLTLILTLPSKILGFFVGILSGYLYVFLLLIILSVPLSSLSAYTNSHLVNRIMQDTPVLSDFLGGFKDSVSDIYRLSDQIKEEDANKNQLNLDIMNSLLKHEVVSSKDMIDLMDHSDKLDHIRGLENLIYKYQ